VKKDFEQRSKAVIEALTVLVRVDPHVVFLGGSSIQALLEKPRRLSIDLDVAYPGETAKLIHGLEAAGYEVKERKSPNPDFAFYTLTKDGVMVKLDVSRYTIKKTETHKIRGLDVLLPEKSYFLAAKLSALSLGTIGRHYAEPVQIIKDIFDINCLLDIETDIENMRNHWLEIISDENRLWGTQFNENECTEGTQKTLLKCVEASRALGFSIQPSALATFQESLTEGKLIRQDVVTMAARALLLLAQMNQKFYEIEKKIPAEAKDKKKLEEAETTLTTKNALAPQHINAIKIIAPNALIYLKYWSDKKH